LDGDNDTLSILGCIFEKDVTPPPDHLTVIDTESAPSELNSTDPVADECGDTVAQAADTEALVVASPLKGRGHR